MDRTYEVAEYFVSINGEGSLAGQLAVFVRLKGCNLACEYCDTKWANEPDAAFTAMTAEEIHQAIKETGVHNVTLTGGEPLARPHIAVSVLHLSAVFRMHRLLPWIINYPAAAWNHSWIQITFHY